MTLVAAVLVVGLLVGAGVGYYMAPEDTSNIATYRLEASYDDGYADGYEQAVADRPTSTTSQYSSSSMDDIEMSVSGLTTLVYGAIGASLVAALAAIVSLMQTSRRM